MGNIGNIFRCDDNGSTPGCLICRRLCDRRGRGYWAIEPDNTGPPSLGTTSVMS